MKRIIIHWTAGTYFPTNYEKEHYHFLVDAKGEIHYGVFKPEANEICKAGKYAAHTGGGNTGLIGVAICAMLNYKSAKSVGKYPITKKQFESTMNFCAQLCKKYNIQITPQTVLTHYEFGKQNPKTTSTGKIDINYLPPYQWITKEEVGSFIRTKIKWYLNKINKIN